MRYGNEILKRSGELLVLLVFVLISSRAWTAELYNNWYSTRALGMGNAYTAVAEGADAIFYNPAGLGFNNGVEWTVFDVHGGFNGLESIQNARTAISLADDVAGSMKKLYGKNIWLGGGAKTAVTVPYFGISAFANSAVGISASNAPNPSIQPNMIFDYGIALGFAVPIVPSVFNLGVTFKRINRTGTTDAIGASQIAAVDPAQLESQLRSRGSGYGMDLGAMVKLPGPVSPSFSAVYRDVGYTSFSHDEGAAAPSRIAPEIALGAALEISAPLLKITPAIDVRYLNRSDLQLGKKINLGLEVSLPLIDLRAGLHQGYYSAGVGLNLALLKLDVSTWGVELGEYPGQLEDRRYMAQVTFELGFGTFGLFGGGNKENPASGGPSGERTTRRLKQRR